MGARTDEPAGRTPGRIEAEISNIVAARQLAEDLGHHNIAALLRTATDLSLDDLNTLNNTREGTCT